MDHVIKCEELIGQHTPWFRRESSQGNTAVGDGSGRTPWVLVFSPRPEVSGGPEYLRAIHENRGEYDRLGARVAIISIGELTLDLPFPVIAGALDLFARFGFMDRQGNPRCGVVVVDRYSQVDCCYSGGDFTDLPAPRVILQRLEGAESVCPECGVPEAQWLDVA